MPQQMTDDYKSFEPSWPFRQDPELARWRARLAALPSSEVSIREAVAGGPDGRRMSDLQAACSPICVKSVRENVSTIVERLVLLAEIEDVHVGFCVAFPGAENSDPLFVQVVGVVPEAQRRGVGLALLSAAAEREPQRDIALATQNDNRAARAMNERFADSIGASTNRVNLGIYSDRDLGIGRGEGYRAWVIKRRNH